MSDPKPSTNGDNGGQAPALRPLLTYAEVAKLLGVCPRSVVNYVQAGELPAVRLGRSVRIDPVDVATFVERKKNLTKTP